MIGTTLEFVANTLNDSLCQRLQIHSSASKVQLSSLVDSTGKIVVKDNNVLLLQLVNIEPDPIANGSDIANRSPFEYIKTETPLYINLRIILSAYFVPEQIKAGLDMLTMGMSYFQGKPMWTPQNSPNLPTGVNRLVFEMEPLNFDQLNHIWGAIGTKYLPSVMYKMRMLAIDDLRLIKKVPTISSVSSDLNTK